MLTLTLKLTGVRPLLMHNSRLADPTNEITRALKALTAAKNKTDAQYEEIKKLEWLGGLYTDQQGRIAVSEDLVLGCGTAGARSLKKGPAFKAAVLGAEAFYPLEYDGPEDLEELFKTGKFVDYRGVVVNRNRTMRARPRFDKWSLTVSLILDESAINPKDVLSAYDFAGRMVGIGDFRPRFGRFTVEKIS